MAYIKSYSNYIIKRKHQDINSGTIFERDTATIGCLNKFTKGQIPIYQSGNLTITVNNENKSNRNFIDSNYGWEKNGSDVVWTLDNINDSNDVESSEKTLKIVLKQDYYRLRDFAYYGSCSELIRTSIIDIVKRFPGELHVPNVNGSGIPVYYKGIDDTEPKRLGDDNLVLVDNPHKINIHTENINESEVEDKLKYLCLSYKDYDLSSMPNVKEFACVDGENKELTDTIKKEINNHKIKKLGVGNKIAEITINDKTIYAYVDSNGDVVYLTNSENIGTTLLKPNNKVYENFFDTLDNFQKILLNKESKPKYSAVFEVVSENSFGYVTELKTFTFPTTYGGYNLAVDNAAYDVYVSSLQRYAEFYDEIFCDNIWRSMTHESIKNFDWTYTREYGVGEEEEYVFGGTRIQKTLRLIGREFDEIKTYIDALKNYQVVNYGKDNAIPDYFLTDAVNQEGWDVENIYPYNNDLKQIQKLESEIKPYSINHICEGHKYGYFYSCSNDTTFTPATSTDTKQEIYDDVLKTIRPRVRQYSNEKVYSLSEINNFFMRMLKLNSKNIFRKKGTIEGIETLLSLFGLKSKRWCDEYNSVLSRYSNNGKCVTSYTPDYEIKEYVCITKGINDPWDSNKKMNKYDWYNYTKTVSYDTDDYRNGIYHSYQGLPVRAYINGNRIDSLPVDTDFSGTNKTLYPYFSPNNIIDGNPYYQMYGGWLNRDYSFTVNNELITSGNVDLYKETYRNIRNVNKLKDLVSLPKTSLKNGDICFVNDINGEYVLIEGVIYDIYTDEKGRFIRTYMSNNSVQLGEKTFASEITVSLSDGSLYRHVFSEYKENTEIRIYIIKNSGLITAYGKYYGINLIQYFKNGTIVNNFNEKGDEDNTYTKIFKLKDVNHKYEINNNGWVQLSYDKNSDEVKKLNSIIDKFKGNNPHTGHLNYDNGKEYLTYFIQLFKHALNEMQFNERCYGADFSIKLDEISKYGFDGIDSEGCNYITYLDNKIHYFGEYFNKNVVKETTSIEKVYKNDGFNIDGKTDGSDITDQIINIKRVDINFFRDKETPTIKYFDNVVMNYLEQILPSTLIINVKYIK